jgi:hypothetical protein
MRAESIKLVEESEGFELHVVDDHGETHLFNVHGCTHDLIEVGRKLADYWTEGRRLAAEHERLEWAAICDVSELDEHRHGLGEIDGGGA